MKMLILMLLFFPTISQAEETAAQWIDKLYRYKALAAKKDRTAAETLERDRLLNEDPTIDPNEAVRILEVEIQEVNQEIKSIEGEYYRTVNRTFELALHGKSYGWVPESAEEYKTLYRRYKQLKPQMEHIVPLYGVVRDALVAKLETIKKVRDEIMAEVNRPRSYEEQIPAPPKVTSKKGSSQVAR